jgi:hypothetical protein
LDTLAILRLFLETYVQRIAPLLAAQAATMSAPLTTLHLHAEADEGHSVVCREYIAARFRLTDLDHMRWTVNFIAQCLRDAQVWIVRSLLK